MTKKKETMQQRILDFDARPKQKEPKQVAKDTSLPPPDFIRSDRQLAYPDALPHYCWPPAGELHDKDTITVDRIHHVDNKDHTDHRFIIKRGDTVKVWFSDQKQETGVVTGISHARNEVRVSYSESSSGVWHSAHCIYPAPEPHPTTPDCVPLSSAIAKANADSTPVDGFADADRVPNTRTYTFAEFKGLLKARGEFGSYHQYRDDFERIVASETAIKEELLATYKAPVLKIIATNLGSCHAKNNTKKQNADSIFRSMLGYFSLDGMTSYSMTETYEDAIKKKVRAVTEEDWNAHQAKKAAKKAELQQAITDPKNLYDFAKFIEARGVAAMSNEQMALWDSLLADLARERRKQNGPSRTVSQFESEELGQVAFSVKEGYHDKKQCPLWIVQLGSRVETSAFRELKFKAKMLGGWWSSFKKTDAGFQFLTEDSATRFTQLLTGDADREDILDSRKERKEQTAAERLHELADALAERSEQTIEESNNSLQNTARRADIQAGIRGRAYADQALARSLHSVAATLSSGDARYLDGVRHKTHLETLDTTLSHAKWARIRAIRKAENESQYGYGLRVRDEEEKACSEDDIRFAKYPHPAIWKRHLEEAVLTCKSLRGAKQISERMRKRIARESGDMVSFSADYDTELLTAFLSRARGAGYDTQCMDRSLENYKRLRSARIDDVHELRAALREYLPHKASVRGDDPVRIAERELIGKDLPGFFPTPATVIEQMLEHADIKSHHSVLEPSCGKGDIAEAIQRHVPDARLTAIELNRTLSDVLGAKGIDCKFTDFLTHGGSYDRIVMNPPFERGQDIEHVRHAFESLAPSGRLVAVMSEGPFFRTDTKSTAFREWLNGLDAECYELPEGAFSGGDAFRSTSVKTRLVVITRL